ncbi:unnamed protein product, partial [Closterium sp. Naga37s-1]
VRLIVNTGLGVLESVTTLDGLFYHTLPGKGEYANVIKSEENVDFHLLLSSVSGAKLITGKSMRGDFPTYTVRFLNAEKEVGASIFVMWKPGTMGDYDEGQADAYQSLVNKYGEELLQSQHVAHPPSPTLALFPRLTATESGVVQVPAMMELKAALTPYINLTSVGDDGDESSTNAVHQPHVVGLPAMMELKAALTPYINLTSWTATNPCSSWWLITCWTNGLVRRMDISSKAIQGNLPSIIGNLTSLDEFFATTNWFNGSLPDSFSRLTAIRNLQLFKNYFEGPIPDSWGNMKNLVQLHLNLNYFSGGLPDTFSQLTNMQKFYVSSNLLNSSFPTVVCTMKNLRELRLSYNHFTGSVPSCLSSLSYLYYLYIDTNQLTGTLPATIGDLPALQNLFINQNSLSGPLPPTITKLTNLRILFMSSNPYLDGPLPSDLGNMVSLTDFVMEFAAFNGTMPDSITKLTRLSRILMDNCRFTGSIPQGISNLKALTVLYLEGNRFRGSFPAGLLTLPKLNLLNLHDNQFSGPLPSGFFNATIVTAGQINIHHNYFNGPATVIAGASPFCPKDQTRNGIFYQSSLAYNCINYPATSACALAPRVETQLSLTTCQAFCGADVAPCGGHGTCWFGVGRSVSCDCDPGYVPTLDGLSCVADTTGVVV